MGYNFNEDNASAPENMPTVSTTITSTPTDYECTFNDWNSYLFCGRLFEGHCHEDPRFTSKYTNDKPHTFLACFIYLCPMVYIKEILVTATNAYIEVNSVTFGEFFKYFGLWLLVANTIASFNRRYWFDDSYQPSMWQGAPFRLGHYMTGY